MTSPIDTYKQVNISQEVSQYRAVQLLLNGAIERIKLARHAQATGNSERRGAAVGSTISIIGAFLSFVGTNDGISPAPCVSNRTWTFFYGEETS